MTTTPENLFFADAHGLSQKWLKVLRLRFVLLLAATLPLSAQINVNTFAGGAIRSGVPAQTVFLDNITGLTWDPAGDIVFCDQTNNVIRSVSANGILGTIAGTGVSGFGGDGGPATAALLSAPAAPHYDAAGNLYFADTGNYRIRRISPGGAISTVAGDGIALEQGMDTSGPALTESLGLVQDLAIAPSGNLYIFDNGIRIVSPDGQLHNFATLPASAQSSGHIAIDGSGNLYVVEGAALQYEAIVEIAPNGTQTDFRLWTAADSNPVTQVGAIAADAAGNVYGISSGAIVRFGQDGSNTNMAGGAQGVLSSTDGPALPSTIFPYALAVSGSGRLAFAEAFSGPIVYYLELNEIRLVTAGSQLQTLAGGAPQIAPDGTPLANAWFEEPTSLAFDSAGNLYIAEFRACLIRKISPAGILSTFAGTGTCAYPAPDGPNAKTADIVQPVSIAVDSLNRVWVADFYLNLYSIAQDGTIANLVKTPVEGGKGQLAVDAQNRVYVLGLDSLYRLLADDSYQAIVAPPSAGGTTGLTDLTAIGADASGHIYFLSFGTIYEVNANGSSTAVYAANPWTGGNSLAIDAVGRFWQGAGGEIDVFGTTGMARLGDLRTGFSGDGGPAIAAGFNGVAGLVFSPAGDLYLLNGTRIRRLTGIGASVATPTIAAVVNAASYTGEAIAPGELLSIFGSNFGTGSVEAAAVANNSYPLVLGRTRVLFNGAVGALTAVTPNQINVFVPATYFLGSTAGVVVEVDATVSSPTMLPVATTAAELFTADASGAGQGAILNQDGSINSAANPAAPGSIVSLYGTGMGALVPQLPLGALAISTPFPAAAPTPEVTIGGQPAEVFYAGDAPYLPDGVFQINFQIPSGTPAGNAAVSVNGSTAAVTVAVQ